MVSTPTVDWICAVIDRPYRVRHACIPSMHTEVTPMHSYSLSCFFVHCVIKKKCAFLKGSIDVSASMCAYMYFTNLNVYNMFTYKHVNIVELYLLNILENCV